MREHKYPIGTQYMTRGKHPNLCTVTDQLTTTNAAGDVIKIRYIATHDFCGQSVMDEDVLEIAVSMGLINE